MRRATPLKNLNFKLACFQRRLKIGGLFVFLLALGLLTRGFYLQIVQHEYYIQRAEAIELHWCRLHPTAV